jgi:transposase
LELTPEGAKALGADKGYDSDKFVAAIEARGMEVVACDWFAYRERHVIECFFGKIKHYRRIFSRFEKLPCNYKGFLQFIFALIWLRQVMSTEPRQ